MGFSASGAILYSWDTNGEAEYWESPLEIALPDGKPTTIAKFSGDPDPIVPANGTSPTSDLGIVNGWSSGSGVQPGVDPATGRVLDRGGAAGVGTWELRDGTTVSPVLFGNGDVPELAWGPGSSLVVAWVASTNGPIRIVLVSAGWSAPGRRGLPGRGRRLLALVLRGARFDRAPRARG